MSDGEATMSGKFTGGADSVVWSQCALCRHNPAAGTEVPAAVCAAFPGSIPGEILANRFDHRRPHPDDTGVAGVEHLTFVPRDDAPPEALARLYRTLNARG